MTRAHRVLETIKTILITALTISAVLIVVLYWTDLSFDSLFAKKPTNDTPSDTPDAPKTREIIAPASISFNLTGEAGGPYAVLFPEECNAWETVVTSFASFSRSEGARVEEATDLTDPASPGARSVHISFGYALPFDGFCKQFGIASAPFGPIPSVSEIVWSEAVPDSLFIRDAGSDGWFRLIGSEETLRPFAELTDTIAKEKANVSYTVRATFGENNVALIPESYELPLRTATVEKEFHALKRDTEADRFARTFFDNSLDFVRRVKDSKDLLTYIYNYTQKVLTISWDGIAEYKEELAAASVNQGFYASLGTALSFVAEHGGWYPAVTVDGEASATGLMPYLRNAEEIISGNRGGYRYAFDFRLGSETLYCGEEAAIVVDVFDGQVTYYRRTLFSGISLVTMPENTTVWTAADALKQNDEWTYGVLSSEGVIPAGVLGSDDERFGFAMRAVNRVSSGYLLDFTNEEDAFAAPAVWAVRAGNILLYYDILTGNGASYTVCAE